MFDVDVRISADQIIRIEFGDKEDPWQVARQFQSVYRLSNEATSALYELLHNSYENELEKRREIQREELEERKSPTGLANAKGAIEESSEEQSVAGEESEIPSDEDHLKEVSRNKIVV